MRIRVGHLYPDYLNIYADRGNIAVLEQRARWRGHELEVRPLRAGASITHGEHDLFYIDNWSFALDVKIIALTVLSPASYRNAY